MIIFSPAGMNAVLVRIIKDKSTGIKPIVRENLSKAEKELNKVINSLNGEEHDRFVAHLIEYDLLYIKFNKNSTSLLFSNDGILQDALYGRRGYSIKHVQDKRNKLIKKLPYQITISLKNEYLVTELKLLMAENFKKNELYYILKLCDDGYFDGGMCDLYFKTQACLNKFMKIYMLEKISFSNYKHEDMIYEIPNTIRQPVFGKNLKYLTRGWDKVYKIGAEQCPGIIRDIKWQIWDDNFSEYVNRLKIAHDWAAKNLEKRFLLMGSDPEIWLFESEEDMNYFLLRWS